VCVFLSLMLRVFSSFLKSFLVFSVSLLFSPSSAYCRVILGFIIVRATVSAVYCVLDPAASLLIRCEVVICTSFGELKDDDCERCLYTPGSSCAKRH